MVEVYALAHDGGRRSCELDFAEAGHASFAYSGVAK